MSMRHLVKAVTSTDFTPSLLVLYKRATALFTDQFHFVQFMIWGLVRDTECPMPNLNSSRKSQSLSLFHKKMTLQNYKF